MNNYCTNCGKKLEKEELVCKDCNTPIVDLPYNYKYRSPARKKAFKTIIIIIVIGLICFLTFIVTKVVVNRINVNVMQKKYVEPYMKANYGAYKYSIKYNYSGKCIISGSCYKNIGCDGSCDEYKYLDKGDCRSIYYSIKMNQKEFTVTVVNNKGHISVIEGKNIYGIKDEDNDDDEPFYDEGGEINE